MGNKPTRLSAIRLAVTSILPNKQHCSHLTTNHINGTTDALLLTCNDGATVRISTRTPTDQGPLRWGVDY